MLYDPTKEAACMKFLANARDECTAMLAEIAAFESVFNSDPGETFKVTESVTEAMLDGFVHGRVALMAEFDGNG